MSSILAVLNHKGGTGKTTTTLNLGKGLSIFSKKVLMVDLDPQANLSQSLGIELEQNTIAEVFEGTLKRLPILSISSGLDLVPASLGLSAIEPSLYSSINSYFILQSQLNYLGDRYDYVIIDCPPSLGMFTQNALIASDGVIVTVQSQFLALKGLATVSDLIDSVRKKLNPSVCIRGLLLTQTNNTNLSKRIADALRQTHSYRVFNTTIRQNVALAEANLKRQDIFSFRPKSTGAQDYLSFAKEIME
jgi:chromosome partitioning protein